MNKTKLTSVGFTLIEMLVVVSIIVLLTSLILANMNGAKMKSRDAKRISDVNQIQLALELYFDRYQIYPQSLNDLAPLYINSLPTNYGGTSYQYVKSANRLDYIVRTTLEMPNEVTKDNVVSNYGVSCSNNWSSSLEYCVGPR